MFRSVFTWLDSNPWFYWAVALGGTFAAVAVWCRRWKGAAPESRSELVVEAFVWLGFLLAWRWPWLLIATELNPDESMFAAGALTLARDPVFWHSVDGTTSGPLNFYVLVPLHLAGLPLDYFVVRLFALLLVWTGLVALHRALRQHGSRLGAGAATAAAALFFALTNESDFLHYSSEHLTLALLPVAIWATLRGDKFQDVRFLNLAAFVAGLAPWSKLQAVPLSGVVIAWALWAAWRHGQRLATPARVALAAAAPTVAILALAASTGQWTTMWQRYLLHNLIYVGDAPPAAEAWSKLLGHASRQGLVHWLGIATLAAVALAIVRAWPAIRRTRVNSLAAAACTAAALVAVLFPQRDFLHYLLFLPMPLAFLGGWAWCAWERDARSRAESIAGRAAMAAVLIAPLALRAAQGTPGIFGEFADHWRRPASADATALRGIARPGDTLAVWGWSSRTHVETQLPQAVRDPHTIWLIRDTPLRDSFRRTYLEDFSRNRPAFFLDATGPGAFIYEDRAAARHELFPALAELIARDYVMLLDVGFSRLYVRADRIQEDGLSVQQLAALAARGRRWPDSLWLAMPDAMRPAPVLRRDGSRVSLIAHAPAVLDWNLSPDWRGLEIEYEFEPAAVGARGGDGVELLLDLVTGESSQRLLRRTYDPQNSAADRSRQRACIIFPPGTRAQVARLTVSPGPTGNNAWDWFSLSRISPVRAENFLPEQFPGFSRLPSEVELNHSDLIVNEGRPLLMVHAPSRLAFRLTGQERTLQFAFGLLDGAYRGDGQSDGAKFRVLLVRGGRETPLFSRLLEPLVRADDRGTQTVRVDLPATDTGDRLVVEIKPGPHNNASWDWTYVREMSLR